MVNSDYVPNRGDIVWINFNPQLGREQRGLRPALVISHKSYNAKVGLALFCPITSKIKDYPFEVVLDLEKTKGSVLCDQVKSLDWKTRNIDFIERINDPEMNEVVARINVLIN